MVFAFVYNFRRIDYLHFIYRDSYRMLEYNIPNPDNPESVHPILSKNCLCWHPGVIFNEKGKNRERDNFHREFEDNVEQGFAGQEVGGNYILNF